MLLLTLQAVQSNWQPLTNMCLYPKLLENRKYKPTKKNNFQPPMLTDQRLKFVSIGCGNCIECRQQKAREWQIRLFEELKSNKYAYFVTLTFSPEELEKLCNQYNLQECNAVAGIAVRHALERVRKKYKKSVKHWLITELGHNNTERIHLHGILFMEKPTNNDEIAKFWKYGETYTGDYCNAKTINYVVKYVTKIDEDHKTYKAEIFCSAGLGKNWLKRNSGRNRFRDEDTIETYKTENLREISLPIYYRNKIYNEEQREKLWIQKIEEHATYVRGIKIENIDTPQGQQRYFDVLHREQEINKKLGYGTDGKEWQKEKYAVTLRMINKEHNRCGERGKIE